MPVYALSVHADYRCRHSGACCTAGWSIPVEAHLRPLLGTALLVPGADGACEHFDRSSRLCRVHRDHGRASKPASCEHFPRRGLVDDRGVFITLSHFCPTAAGSLVHDERPLAIVASPPAFPDGDTYDGLDGRGEWPPLVRPGVLFDLQTYDRWERFLVETLAEDGEPAGSGLARIAATAERVRRWRVEEGPLGEWVDRAIDGARTAPTSRVADRAADRREPDPLALYRELAEPAAFAAVVAAVPSDLPAPPLPAAIDRLLAERVAPAWPAHARTVRRYLAAKAFGSWSAYQARGIRTLVAELVVSETVLRVECARASAAAGCGLDGAVLLEGIRAADRLLMHLVDRPALTAWLGRFESRPALQ